MNKQVLRTMIILCWVFLALYAILKLVPQLVSKFVIVVNNEKIVKVGQFIDSRVWLQQMVYGLTTLLTYHFYLCACVKKWHLSWKQYLVLIAIIVATNTIKYYVSSLCLIINVLIMVILPFALKGDYRTFIIIFVTHYLGQLAISFIRGAEISLVDLNIVSQLICTIDAYVWLLLYYLYANLYKEKKFMGNLMPPLWGKMSKEIKEEKARLEEKLAVCKDEKKCKKYEAQIAELDKMLTDTSDEK
mgnify:CR=1 FL=1